MGEPAWQEIFEQLPQPSQESFLIWLATQNFIATELGLGAEEWFKYIDWAIKNPLDYSFLAELDPALLLAESGPMPTRADLKKAAQVMGKDGQTVQPGSGGMGNLLDVVKQGSEQRRKPGK